MANFKLPKQFKKNSNITAIPQDYLDRENNVLFKGEFKGIKYEITENDFIRREITLFSTEDAMSPIVYEILSKHYGNTVGAGVPSFASNYAYFKI